MDRITSRTQSGQTIVPIKQRKSQPDGPLENPYEAAVSRLAEYEDAEEQGRLWIAPCKMGTTLYMVVTKRPKLNWPEFSFIKTTCLTEHNFFRVIRDFGKTVFLHRIDAEAALAEVKGDKP